MAVDLARQVERARLGRDDVQGGGLAREDLDLPGCGALKLAEASVALRNAGVEKKPGAVNSCRTSPM